MSSQNPQQSLTISIPNTVCASMRNDIAQAHLSLHAIIDLLKDSQSVDPQCIGHLLSYIESSLMKSDDMIFKCMHGGTPIV